MNDRQLSQGLRAFIGMPARDFVRHREPMLLLDTLVDIGADHASCEWRTGDSAFLEAGNGIPAYIGIEYMAQCIAVLAGARARVRGLKPPLGFLLGTRHFQSRTGWFEPGQTYLASCREIVRDSQGMASFACDVSFAAGRVASANLAVFEHPPEEQQED